MDTLTRLPTSDACLIADDGTRVPLPTERFHACPSDAELAVLEPTRSPVVDLGCGPGRIVRALAERGHVVLGIDTSPAALGHARRRGATVLQRSVFDALPGEGRWGTALLLDGNIGIGGDPDRLLRRVRDLLRPAGRALVEVDAPGVSEQHLTVRIHSGQTPSPPFPWALVGTDAIADVADRAGMEVTARARFDGRHFAWLERT